MLSLMFLLCYSEPHPDPRIQNVRDSYLDLSKREKIAEAFESYPWFSRFEWSVQQQDQHEFVVFQGWIPDAKATEDFNRVHQFQYTNIKAMQLQTCYGIDAHRDMLFLKIRFLLGENNSFEVSGGQIGVHHGVTAVWTTRDLENKALVKLIKGFYADRNPYMSLILGLPYK